MKYCLVVCAHACSPLPHPEPPPLCPRVRPASPPGTTQGGTSHPKLLREGALVSGSGLGAAAGLWSVSALEANLSLAPGAESCSQASLPR